MQDMAHHADGVASALMNVHAGMAAAQSCHLDTERRVAPGGNARNFAACGGVDAARAADADVANLLGVEIQKILGLEEARREFGSSGKAGLLVDRERKLQGA